MGAVLKTYQCSGKIGASTRRAHRRWRAHGSPRVDRHSGADDTVCMKVSGKPYGGKYDDERKTEQSGYIGLSAGINMNKPGAQNFSSHAYK